MQVMRYERISVRLDQEEQWETVTEGGRFLFRVSHLEGSPGDSWITARGLGINKDTHKLLSIRRDKIIHVSTLPDNLRLLFEKTEHHPRVPVDYRDIQIGDLIVDLGFTVESVSQYDTDGCVLWDGERQLDLLPGYEILVNRTWEGRDEFLADEKTARRVIMLAARREEMQP